MVAAVFSGKQADWKLLPDTYQYGKGDLHIKNSSISAKYNSFQYHLSSIILEIKWPEHLESQFSQGEIETQRYKIASVH